MNKKNTVILDSELEDYVCVKRDIKTGRIETGISINDGKKEDYFTIFTALTLVHNELLEIIKNRMRKREQ